ncbi:MAG: glycosyltransferase, partial [Gemmatimonadetes bacterium]|nr:glycosyltransferase [Gemmatimonadota bacterium]
MRIVMITGDDLSSFRGGTIHLMEQAQNLLARGHDVLVLAQARGHYPQETPVPIRYLPACGGGLLRLGSYNLALLVQLFWLALRGWPHIIHTRQMGYSATPLLIARLFGLPHVLEVNGVLRDELAGQSVSSLRLWLIDRFARLNLHFSDRFTTTTTEYLRRLEQVYDVEETRWRPMPCGVNPELFGPGDRDAARQMLDLPNVFALLHVGSLYEWRGIDLLLAGLARAHADLPPWELWLVGDGVEVDRLCQQAASLGLQDNVRFVGQVPYDQVPHWLVAAAVFGVGSSGYSDDVFCTAARQLERTLRALGAP